MKVSLTILLVLALQACQYRESGMSITLPKDVGLQEGCLEKAKTIQPITDQLGTIIYFERLMFVRLSPPYSDNINYLPCNLPSNIRNGQKVRFSARVKYQPEIINGAVVDYSGQAIELTSLTLILP